MKSTYRAAALGLAGLAMTTLPGCFTNPEKGEVSVVYCKWLCGDSEPEVVDPGSFKMLFPFRHEVYTLDITTQTLDMSGSDNLEFKTSEGNNIKQPQSLSWKLNPAKAQYIVENVGTDNNEIAEKFVKPLSRSVTRDEYNRLSSSEYYTNDMRFSKANSAQTILNEMLGELGIEIQQIEPKDFQFTDEKYQAAINNAKNALEDKQRHISEKGSQVQHWIGMYNTEKGNSNGLIAKAFGDATSIKHDADAYYSEKRDEAAGIDKQLADKAKGIEDMRKAMASQGGDTAVLLKYVSNFKPETITVLPCDQGGNGLSLDYLNLNELIKGQ